MDLDVFLHQLQFEPDETRPPDLEVNWKDAPLPYKLYQGLPHIPLCAEVPLTLGKKQNATLKSISHFLWYVFGLARFSQVDVQRKPANMARRFVPSGGALYPNELYMYIKTDDLSAGIYHYDVAHHRLVLLREGNFDDYITKALGGSCEVTSCFGVAFVSIMFWKNCFKYHNFSYRLQGLDTGVLLGHLLEVSKQFGFNGAVHFQFLDRALGHLLTLSEEEESVYAIVPLSINPLKQVANRLMQSDAELRETIPKLKHEHYVRSKQLIPYPQLLAMNEASMLQATDSFLCLPEHKPHFRQGNILRLPEVKPISYEFAEVCRRRQSPDGDFSLRKVTAEELASLLYEAHRMHLYKNDSGITNPLAIYGCLYHVEGIPNGAYRYNYEEHALEELNLGDHRLALQYGMTADNVNLFQVPLCLHVVGERKHYRELGYRGYRIQQMDAGMLVQRLLLAASSLGMGGHPLLGFDTKVCDALYGLEQHHETCLIQVPIGSYRARAKLEGGVHA
ncbi:SagB family peptide dehydrogenase [Ectobacillus sp. JY-23]|uniref:SagB/ThcOx family dehydrogenase n=1 Tax=Ectobacillus sp. JY-23 TaxID=2933872 RepID=UPI001FF33609|nr:SagB family peptide dehydrogenase [Ectobacillus sp. JY-23]UOY91776.1 SagB family peptide dehydrogenase [Ectobacillus sp. JY-23]